MFAYFCELCKGVNGCMKPRETLTEPTRLTLLPQNSEACQEAAGKQVKPKKPPNAFVT